MASASNWISLRSEYHPVRGRLRLGSRLPRPGEERSLVADLAPTEGTALARKAVRPRRLPAPASTKKRGSPRARTLLTMSMIFSWFGL